MKNLSIMEVVKQHTEENGSQYLEDVTNHGCQSGICSDLIYYHQTHAFFDTHYEEIEEIRHEAEEMHGTPIFPHGDLKNDLAWFAYEYRAHQLLNEGDE